MLHTLWSKAVGTSDYDKEEWKELQAQIEELQNACLVMLCDVSRYIERGGKLTNKEQAHVDQMRQALSRSST